MTVPSTIDAAAWLSKYLEGDDGDTDLARAMLQAFAETLMSAEASATCGAAYNERSEERTNSRNGYRRRPWDTRAGSVDLAVPKLREGSYFPDWLLTPRRRAEQALVAVIGQAYVEGVSTRRVDDLVKAMGIDGISRSEVSRMAAELDAKVAAFKDRPLDCGPYRYVWIDALTQKVREAGRVVNVSAVIATAVNHQGRARSSASTSSPPRTRPAGRSSSVAWWPAASPASNWSFPTPMAGSKRPSPRSCPTPPGSVVGRISWLT